MAPIDRLLWWRRASTPSLTPGTATVTLNSSGTWSPGSVTGANPLLPLVIRLYGRGGNGGLPEEGVGGAGGGGGGFVQFTRDEWTTGMTFTADFSVGNISLLDGEGNLTVEDGGHASGIIPGLSGPAGINEGMPGGEVTAAFAGGNGGTSGGAMGAGGGASGSVGGEGAAGSGQDGGLPVSADGGIGGDGGDGDVGVDGTAPGGGGGGSGNGSDAQSVGGAGRVVILVPTLT